MTRRLGSSRGLKAEREHEEVHTVVQLFEMQILQRVWEEEFQKYFHLETNRRLFF